MTRYFLVVAVLGSLTSLCAADAPVSPDKVRAASTALKACFAETDPTGAKCKGSVVADDLHFFHTMQSADFCGYAPTASVADAFIRNNMEHVMAANAGIEEVFSSLMQHCLTDSKPDAARIAKVKAIKKVVVLFDAKAKSDDQCPLFKLKAGVLTVTSHPEEMNWGTCSFKFLDGNL